MGFGSLQGYEFMERTAVLFSESTMVPNNYRAKITKGWGDKATSEDNPAAKANCIIALNMSQRMNADPLMIMQNLHVIEGRPSWSSQFIIAAINSCGRYSPLRFDLVQGEEIDASYTTYEWENRQKVAKVTTVKVRNVTCVAWAVELATKTRLESPKVSMEMAVNEGWYSKNGSKWQSMPDLMLRYRSAAFFGRIYAPELLMGLPSAEESRDIIDVTEQADGSFAADFPVMPDRPASSSASARTSNAEDAKEKTFYPADKFTENLPAWRKAIASGKATADGVIAKAQTKHPLTEEQMVAIRAPEPTAVVTDTGPVVTFAQVAEAITKANNIDQLADAADLIGSVANPEQRGELTVKYQSRFDEFTK